MLRTCAPETLEIPGSALTGCPGWPRLETTAIRESRRRFRNAAYRSYHIATAPQHARNLRIAQFCLCVRLAMAL